MPCPKENIGVGIIVNIVSWLRCRFGWVEAKEESRKVESLNQQLCHGVGGRSRLLIELLVAKGAGEDATVQGYGTLTEARSRRVFLRQNTRTKLIISSSGPFGRSTSLPGPHVPRDIDQEANGSFQVGTSIDTYTQRSRKIKKENPATCLVISGFDDCRRPQKRSTSLHF